MRYIASALLCLLSFYIQSEELFDARGFYKNSLINTNKNMQEFLASYLEKNDFIKTHELICEDIASIKSIEDIESMYRATNRIVNLKNYSKPWIVNTKVELSASEPDGLVKYIFLMANGAERKQVPGVVAFRANTGCLVSWSFGKNLEMRVK